jgi:hypothetical protein
MEANNLRALLRRAKLRLLPGNKQPMSDNGGRKKPQVPVFTGDFACIDILCQPGGPDPNEINNLPAADKTAKPLQTPPGTPSAPKRTVVDDSAKVIPIANLQDITAGSIGDGTSLEVYRLRRREKDLECIIEEKNERLVVALQMLNDELIFWRSGLNDHVWESPGTVLRRVARLEGTIERITSKHSKFYPPLEIPAAWKKK